MQPLSRNQRPDLPTSLMNMSLVLRLPHEMPRLPSFLKLLQNHHVLLTFDKVHNQWRLPRKTTSERPKVVRTCGDSNILTWTCASRHYRVHFFDISTSKSAPNLVCFVHLIWKCASRHSGVHLFISHLPRWLPFCTRRMNICLLLDRLVDRKL